MITTTTEEQQDLLITGVHTYNLMVTVFFGGRRVIDSRLAAAAWVRPGDLVLDVGCGPGGLTRRLAAAAGPDGEVIGLDASPAMIDYALRHSSSEPNCRFKLGTAQDLPLPADTFDLVVSTFAMHHIGADHRLTALAEMYRVLRPGGRLLIADIYPGGAVRRRMLKAMTTLAHTTITPADLDLRQYAPALRELGFTEPKFADLLPWTRYMRSTKI